MDAKGSMAWLAQKLEAGRRLLDGTSDMAARRGSRGGLLGVGLAMLGHLRELCRMFTTRPDDLLSYKPSMDKIVEAILLLLGHARADGRALTEGDVLAAVFLADKSHLDAYGRPVTFDNYVATAAGPAGVAARSIIDPSFDWATLGHRSPLWSVADDDDRVMVLSDPLRGADLRLLSATDVDALVSARELMISLDSRQLQRFTHRNAAYAAAWDDGRGEGQRLDPRLVADERNDELIEDLLHMSRYAA